jgi:hypothetical protein
MPREKWQANLDALPEKLGGYKKHELSNWNVHFQAGAPAPGVYTTLVYTVHYSKFDATETFVLYTRDKQAEPKIVGHHIQSDAFLLQ